MNSRRLHIGLISLFLCTCILPGHARAEDRVGVMWVMHNDLDAFRESPAMVRRILSSERTPLIEVPMRAPLEGGAGSFEAYVAGALAQIARSPSPVLGIFLHSHGGPGRI